MNKIYHISATPNQTSNGVLVKWHSTSSDTYLKLLNTGKTYIPQTKIFSTKNLEKTKLDTSFINERFVCEVSIDDLDVETKYDFIIGCCNYKSNIHSFITASKKFNVMVLGDMQCKFNENIIKLVNCYKEKYTSNLAVCSGDLVDCAGSEEEWSHILDNGLFDDSYFATSCGDHEYWANDSESPYPMYDEPFTYQAIFNNPKNGPKKSLNTCYYYGYSNTLFVHLDTLDSNMVESNKMKAQILWLEEVIMHLRNNYQFLIVVMHKSIYGSKIIDSCIRKRLSPMLEGIFKKLKVNLVISGHDHIYSRITKDGIVYLDMGSSGNKYRSIDDSFKDDCYDKLIDLKEYNKGLIGNLAISDHIEVTIIDQEQNTIEEFTING